MGETRRNKKPRYAEPSVHTPDVKAEDMVRKARDTSLEPTLRKTSSDKLLETKLMTARVKHQHHAQYIHKIQERRVPPTVKPLVTPEPDQPDHQARRVECGTLVLGPEETWWSIDLEGGMEKPEVVGPWSGTQKDGPRRKGKADRG